MLEAFDGFFLDLPHPFAGQVKFFPDLLQGVGVFPVEPEIEPYNAGFPVGQRTEFPFDLLSP